MPAVEVNGTPRGGVALLVKNWIPHRKTRTCVLTSGYFLTDNYFWYVGSYILISNVDSEWSSGSQTSLTSFCRYNHFRSEFCFQNGVYITTFPCSWLHNHGGGRSHTMTGQNGRRIGFPGRWDGIQLAGQIGATYVTVWIRVRIYYREFRQTIAYLLRKIWTDCRS